MGMSCLDCHDFMDGYNRGKREGVIEELEKIKAEIEELKSDSDYYEWYGIKRTVNLIDNHISELKGENK